MTPPPAELNRRLDACVHCGLCLEHCPTYALGASEPDSPRGRIVLIRGLFDGSIAPSPPVAAHLDGCLDCRACETACPSGVAYGELISAIRAAQPAAERGWADRWLWPRLMGMLSNRDRLRRALWLARLAEVLGVRRWLADGGGPAWLPAWVRPMAALLPAEAPAVAPLRSWVPPRGAGRGTASLFAGCVNEAVLPQINRATVRVLSAGGYGVRCPERQVCCGAIHEHAGDLETARALARRNIDALSGDDAVLVNVAGCGAMLKRYPALLADDRAYASPAARFAARVVDVSEFWARRLSAERLTPQAQTVAYHDACHLAHAQGIRRPPREMLTAIPGLKLVELPESEMCCGAAGTYNLRHAQTAGELARRKIANVRECGATCVAAGNAGCLLHLSAAARAAGDATVRFVHPIELVAAALPGDR